MRRLGDEHGDAFWGANLYNLWQGALRALSPAADIGQGGAGCRRWPGPRPGAGAC